MAVGYVLMISNEIFMDLYYPHVFDKLGRWDWTTISLFACVWHFMVYAFLAAFYERVRYGRF